MIREERSLSLVSSISATISSTVRAVDSMGGEGEAEKIRMYIHRGKE